MAPTSKMNIMIKSTFRITTPTIFNLVVAGTCLALGIWLWIGYDRYLEMARDVYGWYLTSRLLILVAVISFSSVVSLIFAWIMDSKRLMIIFIIWLCIEQLILIAISIVSFYGASKYNEISDRNPIAIQLRQNINSYNHDPSKGSISYARILDQIQSHYGCCGWENKTDWHITTVYHETDTYPHSCCKQTKTDPVESVCNSASSYSVGCIYMVFPHWKRLHLGVGVVTLLNCLIGAIVISILLVGRQ